MKLRVKKPPIIASVFFVMVVLIGLLLRFYHIEQVIGFGWDQARDSFHVSRLLHGTLLLDGPKTGIGNFHLGPLYFYLLAPFYFFTNLDPIGSQYANILLSALTFVIIFFVTKKLFSLPFAFLAIGMYAINSYIADLNRIPWNVSLIPPLSFLIFYFTYRTFTEKKFVPTALLMTCCGMFFHAHFTALVFPLAIILLWLLNSDKVKLLKLFILTLPFYLLWYIPTIVSFFTTDHSHYYLARDFMTYYFVGVHLQFVLYRLPDAVIQFRNLLLLPRFGDYLFIVGILALYFFSNRKLEIRIMLSWILATIAVFGVYGGPISDYYFFFTLPVVLYSFLILVEYLTKLHKPLALTLLSLFLIYYMYSNLLHGFDILQRKGGLAEQRKTVQKMIQRREIMQFNEGDIRSYFYYLYTNKL